MKPNDLMRSEIKETATIAATYKAQRDGGLIYTYEAEWTLVGHTIVWHAVVMRDGLFRGRPSGTIDLRSESEVHRTLMNIIEMRIERMSDVVR